MEEGVMARTPSKVVIKARTTRISTSIIDHPVKITPAKMYKPKTAVAPRIRAPKRGRVKDFRLD
jgi:hypothetical protein